LRPPLWVLYGEQVRTGDVLRATIEQQICDADGHDDKGRQFRLDVLRDGSRVFTQTLSGLRRPEAIEDRPLALCVALKYANDGVSLRRVEPGDVAA
jgi:hypothetical protein